MDGLADILNGGESEDVYLAGLRIDLHVDDKRASGAGRIHRAAAKNGLPGRFDLVGQFLERHPELGVCRGHEDAVLQFQRIGVDVPNQCCPRDHLPCNVLGGLVSGPARGERGAASAGQEGEAHRVGVSHRRMDVLGGNAEHFSGLHCNGRSAARQIGGAFDQGRRAVGVYGDGATGVKADAAREPDRDASATVWPFKRRRVVGMVFHRLQHLDAADESVGWTFGPWSALFGRVPEPELNRIDSEAVGDVVDHRLNGERGVGGAGRAIRLGLGFVRQHVKAVDRHVRNVVRDEDAHCRNRDQRTREAAGFVRQRRLGRGDGALLGRAYLDFDVRARSRSCALKDLLARHHHLHWLARLLREERRHGIEVQGGLAAEPAADLQRRDFDLRHGQIQYPGDRGPRAESALGAGPNVQPAVRVPKRGAIVRFDVALVHSAGVELTLDDHIGVLEPVAGISQTEPEPAGDVAWFVARLAEP